MLDDPGWGESQTDASGAGSVESRPVVVSVLGSDPIPHLAIRVGLDLDRGSDLDVAERSVGVDDRERDAWVVQHVAVLGAFAQGRDDDVVAVKPVPHRGAVGAAVAQQCGEYGGVRSDEKIVVVGVYVGHAPYRTPMMDTVSTNLPIRPRRGRPLSRQVERAVFDEALRLVALDDASEVTLRAIADGAGVSRQTLYNRWCSTADIVLEALIDRAAVTVGVIGHTDLRTYLERLADAVNGWARPGLRTVAAYAQLDREFAERFRSRFLDTRHAALTDVVQDAQPLRAARHAEQTAELIAGSLWFRLIITDQPLDDAWIDQMTALARADTDRHDRARRSEPSSSSSRT